MTVLVVIVLLSLALRSPCHASTIKTCTRADLCLPVFADVCDNSKCLLLNQSDIDEIINSGVKSYTWNIAQTLYNGYCPLKSSFTPSPKYDANTETNAVYTLSSGEGCKDSISATYTFKGDPDPHTGQVKLLTLDIAGDTYESCYTYFEKGAAFVYRRCLVDPTYPAGHACAAIYAQEIASGNCQRQNLRQYLDGLKVNFPQINTDCF